MEIYDIHEYIKRKVFRAIIKIAIFKGIFKYETQVQNEIPSFLSVNAY